MYEHSVYPGGIFVEEDVIDDTRFRVLFTPDFKRRVGISRIRDKVRRRFNLSEGSIERMFAGHPVVVKENVDLLTAYQYKLAIDETGATGKIEVMPSIEKQRAHADAVRRVQQLRRQLALMAARKRKRTAEQAAASPVPNRVASAKRLANAMPGQPDAVQAASAAPRRRRVAASSRRRVAASI